MYENINDNGKIVKVRKQHKCEWCGETIWIGEVAVRRVYKFDGDFHDTRMHPVCFNALKKSLFEEGSIEEEGFIPGEYERGKSKNESGILPEVTIELEEEEVKTVVGSVLNFGKELQKSSPEKFKEFQKEIRKWLQSKDPDMIAVNIFVFVLLLVSIFIFIFTIFSC